MTARLARWMTLCLAALSLAGCLRGPLSWQRLTINQPISEEDISFIVKGSTKLTEVVARLGTPDDLQAVHDTIVVRYSFFDGKYFRGDYGWGLRFVLPFFSPDLVLGGGGFGTNTFQLTVDPQWIVHDHAFAWHAHSSEFRFWPFGESDHERLRNPCPE